MTSPILPSCKVLMSFTMCFLFNAVVAAKNCNPNGYKVPEKCHGNRAFCLSYNGAPVVKSALYKFGNAMKATIGCHYFMGPSEYTNKVTVDLTFISELRTFTRLSSCGIVMSTINARRTDRSTSTISDEVLPKEAKDCRNLMKPIHLSPDMKTRSLTCEAVVSYTPSLKQIYTETITFNYVPPATTISPTTLRTTTTTTLQTTTPTTTTTTLTSAKILTTTPTTTPTTTTTPKTSPTITPTTKPRTTQKTTTTSIPTTKSITTQTTTSSTIAPTTITSVTTAPTTITTENISTNNEVEDKVNKNTEEDNKNDGEDTKNSKEFNKNSENYNKSDGEVNPNDQEVIESFLKKHWILLTAGFGLLCVIIVSIVLTCTVLRTRKKQKEDKTRLNPTGSRNDLDVTQSPPGRNEARTEPKLNDNYSDINYDYTPELYSDPYMAMYSQPLPKCVRPPPKVTPKPKPKPKPSYRDYSNSSHRKYNGYDELNEPSTYNNIVNKGSTMYNNTGKTQKNTECVQFYDNMAASYSNTSKGIYPGVNSEPALYEVPS